MKGVQFSVEGIRKGTFSIKNGIYSCKRVRVWTSGRSIPAPYKTLLSAPPWGRGGGVKVRKRQQR